MYAGGRPPCIIVHGATIITKSVGSILLAICIQPVYTAGSIMCEYKTDNLVQSICVCVKCMCMLCVCL